MPLPPHPDKNRWITPHRPLTTEASIDGEVAGGEGRRSPLLNRPGSGFKSRFVTDQSNTKFKYGALRFRRPPAAMTDGSGGLAGGGGDQQEAKRSRPNLISTDPYWNNGGSSGWEFPEESSSEEGGVVYAGIEDLSCADSSPVFFPFPMEGSQWDAAVKEAENQMLKEGFTWSEINHASPKRR